MELQPVKDFKDLLALFNARNVEFMVVGGYALAFHGAPRATGDLDLWIRPDVENAQRILAALNDFGFGSLNLRVEDFTKSGHIVQLGVPPVRVDILTTISGVAWEKAWKNRRPATYGGEPVSFIGLEDFVTNKKAVGRHRDLADIEALGEAS